MPPGGLASGLGISGSWSAVPGSRVSSGVWSSMSERDGGLGLVGRTRAWRRGFGAKSYLVVPPLGCGRPAYLASTTIRGYAVSGTAAIHVTTVHGYGTNKVSTSDLLGKVGVVLHGQNGGMNETLQPVQRGGGELGRGQIANTNLTGHNYARLQQKDGYKCKGIDLKLTENQSDFSQISESIQEVRTRLALSST